MTTPETKPNRWTARRVGLAAVLLLICALCFGSAALSLRELLNEPIAARQSETAAQRETEPHNFKGLTVPRDEILPGGPPKDGIPALTNPKVEAIDADLNIRTDARVIGVTLGGEARAYPIPILNYHEIVNDELGGVPIAVIYCPLCDSASVVDRRLDGQTYEFGVSGLLYNSNVLLYDRTDHALWSQIGFEAISGPNAGRSFDHIYSWSITTIGEWAAEHPDSTVVTTDTGHVRNYEANPYAGFFRSPEPHPTFARTIRRDDRLPSKARVVGVRIGDQARAYPLNPPDHEGPFRVEDELGGERVVIEFDPKDGQARIVEVPEGAQVVHTFWYAWAGFHPETDIHGLEEGETIDAVPRDEEPELVIP